MFPLLADAASKSPKEVVALWRTLPKLAKDTPDAAYRTLHTWLPNRGLRGLYAKAQFALNFAQLQKLSGQKIFGSGPHQNGKLNLKSANDFGHYNPAFIIWITANGIPGQTNPKLRKELQPVYDKYLRRTARGFFVAHQNLKAQPRRLKQVQARYLELLGESSEFPEEGYEGKYIIDIAKTLQEKNGDSLKDSIDVRKKSHASTAGPCYSSRIMMLQQQDHDATTAGS